MSDIKLFQRSGEKFEQLEGSSVAVEKSLQDLIERHSETFLGVRFVATEYSTGKKHGGRIDTLGLDENGCPVIIEYKRALNENVINQGLYYLDWLLDHKAEFSLLAIEKFGKEAADAIEWTNPRLLCIAGDFTKFDSHAVQQINRNIELIRYRKYPGDLLLLELANATTMQGPVEDGGSTSVKGGNYHMKTASEYLAEASDEQRDLFEQMQAMLVALGDDVQMKTLKYYIAFKRLRNFACADLKLDGRILVYVKVDPASADLEDGFTRDVTDIGHYGTGDLEITLKAPEDLDRAQPFLLESYENA